MSSRTAYQAIPAFSTHCGTRHVIETVLLGSRYGVYLGRIRATQFLGASLCAEIFFSVGDDGGFGYGHYASQHVPGQHDLSRCAASGYCQIFDGRMLQNLGGLLRVVGIGIGQRGISVHYHPLALELINEILLWKVRMELDLVNLGFDSSYFEHRVDLSWVVVGDTNETNFVGGRKCLHALPCFDRIKSAAPLRPMDQKQVDVIQSELRKVLAKAGLSIRMSVRSVKLPQIGVHILAIPQLGSDPQIFTGDASAFDAFAYASANIALIHVDVGTINQSIASLDGRSHSFCRVTSTQIPERISSPSRQ